MISKFSHFSLVQLLDASIYEFGSTNHPQPPSCLVEVIADQKPDTEEALRYVVPVLGIDPYYEICIIRSLRSVASTVSKSVKSEGNNYI